MNKHILPKFIITTVSIACVLFSAESLFAKAPAVKSNTNEESETLQTQARRYREAGAESQRIGNLTEAMALYQKAITLDPGYAVAYNDLGVIYEAQDVPEKAEENYLKSIKIDPNYAGACTNLALFYEGQRDLEKAAFYWAKRAEIGPPDDPWTQKAISRIKDIRLALSKQPIADEREEEVLSLMDDVTAEKAIITKDDDALVRAHFQKAKQYFNKGDMASAIKEALDAQYLDPKNKEIEAFIEKTESRALSR